MVLSMNSAAHTHGSENMNHVEFKKAYDCRLFHNDEYVNILDRQSVFIVSHYEEDPRTLLDDGRYMVVWAVTPDGMRTPGYLHGYNRINALIHVHGDNWHKQIR